MKSVVAGKKILLTLSQGQLSGGMETVAHLMKKIFPDIEVWGRESIPADARASLSIPFMHEPSVGLALAKLVSAQACHPQLLITSSMHGWAFPSKQKGIPTISLMHGPDPGFAERAFKPTDLAGWRFKHVYAWFEKRSAENADIIIANSHFTQRELQKWYGLPSRVLELPIDTRIFFPAAQKQKSLIRKRLGLHAAKPLVLFAGNPNYSKGWDIFTQLPPLFPRSQFLAVIAMQGDLPQIPGMEIRRAVPQELFADYCRAADVVVFPSRYEGFGFIPLESLACGAKVVSAKVGIFHDYTPKNWFEAKEHSVQEFAHQLGRALDSKSAPRSNFTEIKRRFNLEKYASEFTAIAKELVQRSPATTQSSEGLHA